ncbi:conserved virulence factor C family protein [Priestia flexa]|jgi:Virulence factor/Scaffold protein Nfu/NifU N terminal/HEAT repeats|uniref:Conserved virulence factor C family protein n=1 Tax=Priestia flexa TaxID=86664 RepID=A0A8I1MI58_9BACI|nr:conserved virulence factor C family protein [Priestia flexa]MBN8253301.1 conserved virulence factor C family protein [Priestia flexa]RIV11228.1 virulence factor [Priestia flexa]UIR31424.1 conserved virulence factor C family protein [Priestia flexa]
MKIKSIEPTPSPNTMKINLNEVLPGGKSNNYHKDNSHEAPAVIQEIMKVEGVKGVYHVADFLAVERNAKYDWKQILPQVRAAFGEDVQDETENQQINEHYGEVSVAVQLFKNVPMQVKLTDGTEEKRFGLPDRFAKAVAEVQQFASNVVLERKWKEQGVRYGELEAIGEDVVEELSAAYPEERLNRLVQLAKQEESGEQVVKPREAYKVTEEMLDEEDWTVRYAHLEQMNPTEEDLPVLNKALDDEKASIRRLATVYLGMIESKEVLPFLYKALKDKSVTVRRTAGDCMSDLGFEEGIAAMCEALQDKSKLVRWRAAMFLYEVGDETALSALKAAENDPEFEVDLQIKLAIERIAGGEEAKGSVWKQMTESRKG